MNITNNSNYAFSALLSAAAEAEQELPSDWITACDDECDDETFTEEQELVCWGKCIQALKDSEVDKDWKNIIIHNSNKTQ